MPTYLFYDLETTGLNPAFDQIVRFAAVRTDMMLNELEQESIHVRLRPDIAPAPEAVLTHGIGISEMLEGTCEYEAICRIHRMMNTAGTISVGYNSLGFDDAFLRFSFHRNLLHPYTHQYDSGCRRMDLFPMAMAFRLYRPHLLCWPDCNGKPSLKLEEINAANNLHFGRAHDAMDDVRATLALARKFREEYRMWDFLCGCFHKITDVKRMQKLPISLTTLYGPHCRAMMIAVEFGADRLFQAPVLSLGASLPYPNQTLWLRLDDERIPRTVEEDVAANTRVIRKKSGEAGLLTPPLDRYWNRMEKERRSLAEENLQWLSSHPECLERIARFHREFRYPEIPNVDADACLYQMGFLDDREWQACEDFHSLPLPGKLRLIEELSRPELQTLAKRILFRNYHDQLPSSWSSVVDDHMRKAAPPANASPMVDYKGNFRITPGEVLERIEALKAQPNLRQDQLELLSSLSEYLCDHFDRFDR